MDPTFDGALLFPGPGGNLAGAILMAWDTDNAQAYAVGYKGGSATRELPVTSTPAPVPGTIFTDPDTAVAVAATVPLPGISSGTRTLTVQNTAAGSLVRIREVGGAPGSGILLAYLGTAEYSSSVASLEAENVGAVPATVAQQAEKI